MAEPNNMPALGSALVTGGTRGLGRALVMALHSDGVCTFTIARRRRGIEALERDAPGVTTCQGDLTERGTTARVARRLARDGVNLDLIIHNAGLLGPRVPLALWSRKDFDAVIAANLSAPFDLTRRLLPRCTPRSTVVFISSGVTDGVRRNWGAYQVSKVAVENLAQTFALELGDAGPRILIYDPGRMGTEMRHAAYPDEDPTTLPDPDEVAHHLLGLVGSSTWQSGDRLSFNG